MKNNSSKKKFEGKKKLFKKYNKKKNGKACYVEWDLDASSDSDSDDDDEKPSKKGLVDIAIMEGIKNGFSAKHTRSKMELLKERIGL
jgi:hypothetical protein